MARRDPVLYGGLAWRGMGDEMGLEGAAQHRLQTLDLVGRFQ